jgi:exo-beta-1,3-glucanase (GH17 family)
MRSQFILLLLGLGLSVAHPSQHGARHAAHMHAHKRHQGAEQVVARDESVTETVEVIVYEDSNGNPVSTSTSIILGAPSAVPAAQVQQENPPQDTKPTTTSDAATPPPSPPSQNLSQQSGTSDPPSGNAPTGGPGFKSGITYSQYLADGECRSADQVASDVSDILSHGHDLIRIYGSDCNGPANLFAAIKGKPVSMFLGIYDISQASTEASSIASQLNNDWSQVNTISVGNELINDGSASVEAVTGAIGAVRSQLRGLGYQGPVVTVDTMVAVLANPELCTASDYCAINCHAFFDGGVAPDGAGGFVEMFAGKVAAIAGGKTVVITESGWPSCGTPNKIAATGPSPQEQAIASLKSSFASNMILFSAYNEYWKKNNDGTFGAENCWGIYGNSPSAQ